MAGGRGRGVTAAITALFCAPTCVTHLCPSVHPPSCFAHLCPSVHPPSRLCCSEYPPTIYISMVRDAPTAKKIEANRKELTRRRTPVEVVQVRWGGAELRPAAAVACGGMAWQPLHGSTKHAHALGGNSGDWCSDGCPLACASRERRASSFPVRPAPHCRATFLSTLLPRLSIRGRCQLHPWDLPLRLRPLQAPSLAPLGFTLHPNRWRSARFTPLTSPTASHPRSPPVSGWFVPHGSWLRWDVFVCNGVS